DSGKPIGEAVVLVDGRASLTHSFSGTGSHTIVAKYSGAEGFIESSSIAGVLVIAEPGGPTGAGTGSLSFGS
ncbi:Ig-like domain-containing protein, partial [Prescottella equi]|uniref:Ig-like domain-containing protein n=1 Tax=Rhodococcus hoagii TaxID=43767 RepID=UPI0011312D96